MSEITAEQIRKATSFVLTDNKYFDEDTRVGETYRLHVALNGTVYHVDDSGYSWTHVRDKGEIRPRIAEALAAGHITYHFPEEKPSKFSVKWADVIGIGTYSAFVFTDLAGLELLQKIERETDRQSKLESLKRQLDEIQRKIDELEQAK